MMLYFLLQIAMLVIGISLVARVWRASVLEGILCLFIPFYVLVPMIKHWNDPDHDIRFHVLLLFSGAIALVWVQYRLVHEIAAESGTEQVASADQAQTRAGDVLVEDGDGDEDVPDTMQPQVTLEIGPAKRKALVERSAPVAAALRSHEPDTPARAPPETITDAPPTLRQAIAAATFLRGVFERATLGFAIDLPDHFHALAAGDARRIEASEQLPGDVHEVAWVVHESVALDSPAAWHVAVRWLSDGWVAANGEFDPSRLLQDAQRGHASPRLAGSGGDLVGYAVAPSYSNSVADWVEERLPAGAAASVLDCHAVRLGRKGVVEFSVVGAAAGSQSLCHASVRLLARSTRFESGADYSPVATDAPRAPYTLGALIAGLH